MAGGRRHAPVRGCCRAEGGRRRRMYSTVAPVPSCRAGKPAANTANNGVDAGTSLSCRSLPHCTATRTTAAGSAALAPVGSGSGAVCRGGGGAVPRFVPRFLAPAPALAMSSTVPRCSPRKRKGEARSTSFPLCFKVYSAACDASLCACRPCALLPAHAHPNPSPRRTPRALLPVMAAGVRIHLHLAAHALQAPRTRVWVGARLSAWRLPLERTMTLMAAAGLAAAAPALRCGLLKWHGACSSPCRELHGAP